MRFAPHAEPAKPLSGTQPPEGRPFAVPSTLFNRRSDTGFRISAATMLKICLVILGVVLGVYAIYRVLPVLLLVFIAIMLATARHAGQRAPGILIGPSRWNAVRCVSSCFSRARTASRSFHPT